MVGHSTVLTVGTLLSRAETAGSEVRVLVEGNWIVGVPVAADGHGAVLDTGSGQCLVRIESVSAVSFEQAAERMPAPRPSLDEAPAWAS